MGNSVLSAPWRRRFLLSPCSSRRGCTPTTKMGNAVDTQPSQRASRAYFRRQRPCQEGRITGFTWMRRGFWLSVFLFSRLAGFLGFGWGVNRASERKNQLARQFAYVSPTQFEAFRWPSVQRSRRRRGSPAALRARAHRTGQRPAIKVAFLFSQGGA